MILLDTDIVSEMMRPSPARAVVDWLNEQDAASLFLATVTIAEIGYRLRILPDGRRRRLLEESFKKLIAEAFEHRVISFDESAAQMYGDIMGHRKEIGRPLSVPDGQIAAIARAHDCAIATRNVRDFEECRLSIVNPFEMP